MTSLSQFKSSVAKSWSKVLWDGLIDAMEARLAPLEEQLGIQRAVVDAIIERGLRVIEDQLAPVVTQAEDRLSVIEQAQVAALAAYGVIQALADQDIGEVIQPLLIQSQSMLEDAQNALATALATIASIQSTTEKNLPNGYAGLDGAGKLPWSRLADVPTAEPAAAGVVSLASNSEVITGSVTDKAVTPAGLSARTATVERRGIVALATSETTLAGTDSDRAVTPAALAAVMSDLPSFSTIGKAIAKAAGTGAAQNAIGATTVGKAVLTAVDAAAGRTAIGAQAALGYTPVSRAGDTMTGSLSLQSASGLSPQIAFKTWNDFQQYGQIFCDSASGLPIRVRLGVQAPINGQSATFDFYANGSLNVPGALSKASGTFLIDHPLDPLNKDLAHGFIEGPRYGLIYYGVAKLVAGRATVDIDDESGMSAGTFAALTKNARVVSLQNQDGFARVKPGPIDGERFEIICEHEDCTDAIAWVVIAERNDPYVRELDPNTYHDGPNKGGLIVERDKPDYAGADA